MSANRFKQLLFGLFIGLVGIIVTLTPLGMALEEKFGLYWLFQLRGEVPAPDDVVVIAIDQPSATELDLPLNPRLWPRDLHARLIDKLTDAGARVIVFDLLFETPGKVPSHDEQLGHAMQKARNVVVVERLDIVEMPLIPSQVNPIKYNAITTGTAPLLPIIANAALARAPFLLPESSNVTVYWTFKTRAGDTPTIPAVALQVFALPVFEDFVRLLAKVNSTYAAKLPADKNALDIEAVTYTLRQLFANEPHIAQQMQEELQRDTKLNTEEKGLIVSLIKLYAGEAMRYLNFYGQPRSVQTVPYHQALLSPDHDLAESNYPDFNGKAVFVGFSAASQAEQDKVRDNYHTVFPTPDGLAISGVEVAATAFANLLENKPISPLPTNENLVLLSLLGFTFGVIFLALPTRIAALATVVLVMVYIGNASVQFEATGTWLPLFVPLMMQLPLAAFGALALKYRNEKWERQQIEEQFGRFLPERVVKHIKKSVDHITANNQLLYGVCLATDIKDYTPLSEKMSPARLSQLMNDYFAALFEPVEKYNGEVSDVVGDAMLALWTAPAANADLRKKACLACLEIAAAVDRFNQAGHRPNLTTRIGLHFGEMMLGSVGASHHFEYRAVGDVVNTANRIQAANKKLGTRLLLSREVVEGLNDFLIRPFGDFMLVGKSSPVGLAELVAHKQAATLEQLWLCEIFADAVHAYQSGKWQQACTVFSEILKAFPDDGPTNLFLNHCQQHNFSMPTGSLRPVMQVTNK